jgi:hypothetical protein
MTAPILGEIALTQIPGIKESSVERTFCGRRYRITLSGVETAALEKAAGAIFDILKGPLEQLAVNEKASYKTISTGIEVQKGNDAPIQITSAAAKSLSEVLHKGNESIIQYGIAFEQTRHPQIQGLPNFGNSCFFNTTLQIWMNTERLRKELIAHPEAFGRLGETHPLYKILHQYDQGHSITERDLRELLTLVDQHLKRRADQQLDADEVNNAFVEFLDFSKIPSLASIMTASWSSEPLVGKNSQQLWIPNAPPPPPTLARIYGALKQNQTFDDFLWNALHDQNPEKTILAGQQLAIQSTRNRFTTPPKALVINVLRNIPDPDRTSEETLKKMIELLQIKGNDPLKQARDILRSPEKFQEVLRSSKELGKLNFQRKQDQTPLRAPLQFQTPKWLSEDEKRTPLTLTGFSFRQEHGGANSGHYYAYVQQNGHYYRISDTQKSEVLESEFREAAQKATQLIYSA